MGRKKSDVSGYGLRETVDYRIVDEMLALHSVIKHLIKKGKEDSEEEKAMQQARALFNIK
jgi:hypothetical protein